MTIRTINTKVCVAGGGPAGIMTGYLLARAGIEVLVLEKHKDFLRDFRGDTVHPSTMQIMSELGLLEEFLKLPHQKTEHLTAVMGHTPLEVVDFTHLPVAAPFIAFMPQWDFLDFMADKAAAFPGFHLLRRVEITGLLSDKDQVTGVTAKTPDGGLHVNAELVIGADGRGSVVRDAAALDVTKSDVPIDVLWFRLPRKDTDPEDTEAHFDTGAITILLNRGDYWQCAFVIEKGGLDRLKSEGLERFRERLVRSVDFLADRVEALQDWDDLKLLTVMVDHLETWHKDGLLCIGDAAHAMSPVGGVGINLAIQDAVATANHLAPILNHGRPTPDDLAAIAKRRLPPTLKTQFAQTTIHKKVIYGTLESEGEFHPPFALKVLTKIPAFREITGRAVGLGLKPEHIDPKAIPIAG